MKKTSLSALMAVVMASSIMAGCFDSGSDVAKDNKGSSPAAESNVTDEDLIAEQEASDQALIASQTPTTEPAQEGGFQKVSMSQSTPESDDAFADFMSSSLSVIIPTDMPDKGGVSNNPMKTNGSVVLKAARTVPVNNPTYNGNNLVDCSVVPTTEAFYCSDQYLVQVQKSKNRIKLKDGSELVLTPAANGQADSYMLSYVKGNVATPSFYTLSSFGPENDLKVRYARIKNEACMYGAPEYLGVRSSDIYSCYKPSNENEKDLAGPVVSGSANKTSFTNSDISDMSKTSYDSFYKITL